MMSSKILNAVLCVCTLITQTCPDEEIQQCNESARYEKVHLDFDDIPDFQSYTYGFIPPPRNAYYQTSWPRIHSVKGILTPTIWNRTDLYYITHLDISNAEVYGIEGRTFHEFDCLRNMSLAHNNITELKNLTFDGLEKLELLDLSWNFIENVDFEAFKGLFLLREVYLSHNRIVQLEKSVIQSMLPLRRLDLSYNNINYLAMSYFNTTVNMHELIFSHNNIYYLDTEPYEKYSVGVERLYVDNNKLVFAHLNWLKESAPLLKYVALGNNKWNCSQNDFMKYWCLILNITTDLKSMGCLIPDINIHNVNNEPKLFQKPVSIHTEGPILNWSLGLIISSAALVGIAFGVFAYLKWLKPAVHSVFYRCCRQPVNIEMAADGSHHVVEPPAQQNEEMQMQVMQPIRQLSESESDQETPPTEETATVAV